MPADKAGMDEKGAPRLHVTGPARISVLGDTQREIRGSADKMFGQGLCLTVEEPLAPGTAVMVEWDDTEVLGEISSCEQTSGGFTVGMTLRHALLGTKELARLAHRL